MAGFPAIYENKSLFKIRGIDDKRSGACFVAFVYCFACARFLACCGMMRGFCFMAFVIGRALILSSGNNGQTLANH